MKTNKPLEGALIFFMVHDLWQKDKKFTYKDLSKYYDKHYDEYKHVEHPEWAWNYDKDKDADEWKKKRRIIAKQVIKVVEDNI